jgi:hypothetical protein
MHECKKDDLISDGEDRWDSAENNRGAVQPAGEEVPYELPPLRYACGKPHYWSSGTTALEHVERLDWSGLFRTRLLIDADRYRETLECSGDSDYWVLVDMRYQRVPKGSLLWHTSFSFWSDPPWSTHHCPDEANTLGRQKLKSRKGYKLDTEILLREWYRYSVPALQKLVDPKARKAIRVSDRSYMPPTFLVAVPKRRSGALAAIGDLTGHDDRLHIPPGVSNEVLRTENYESLPQALLKGKVHAFRRFFPDGTVDEPRYLLVPDRRVSIRSSGGVSRWLLAQEEAAASGVRILTDLEAFAASELGGIDSRTQIRKNHLRIYQGVAEQAGTLWDALARLLPDATKALFLPGASKRSLDTVHRSIEMIHQTLLQGVADLDQLARNISDARSHIESTADEVADRFDRQLDHPRSDGKGPMLRDSLRGGPLDRLRRQAKEASSDADRVAESYRMLLETIGMAFDERRVREGDRLQRASIWLAVAFGVLGLSGVAQATLPLPTLGSGDHRIFLVRWVLWLITVGVILAMLVILLSPQLRVQVASRAFERKYMVVRDFLTDVSTDHLDSFRREQELPSSIRRPDYTSPWRTRDEELTRKFVHAWTIASKKQANTTIDAYYATGLRSRVEEWTLQTLMLTERPRDFSRYALPYLTSLYRICTAGTERLARCRGNA